MKSGVTSSGSPNQKASTSDRPIPVLATSRIREARSNRTASRATSGKTFGFMRSGFLQ
jgi:hypothetical protein